MKATKLSVDVALLKKYDRPGPRYTSYPTAPYFHTGIGPDEYIKQIQQGNRSAAQRELSLYVHLPFCDTLCYFCGCNMMVTQSRQKIEQYLDYLEKELHLLQAQLAPDRKLAHLQWGGGTPTHLSPMQIRRLGDLIHRSFTFTKGAEVGVEIDPRELTWEHMTALQALGFNRCSIGVQDFDPQVQKAVNRIQPQAVTQQAITWARELGFKSVNIDLMYGLPFQTVASFEATLDRVLAFGPDRLAIFNYAHLPQQIKHQQLIQVDWLPTPEQKLQLLKLSIEKLTDAGYVYIGMDHFAKPENELALAQQNGTLYRNFQGYSTHAGLELFALGMTGIGMLSTLYVQNYKTLREYYAALDERRLPILRGVALTADDCLRREGITELMCNLTLKKAAIAAKYALDFDAYFADTLEQLEPLQQDGLIDLGAEKLTVTPAGRLLIRNIAMVFDAYLQKQAEQKPQFSRTI